MISKYRVLLCALLLVVISKSLFAFDEYDPAESSRLIGQFFRKIEQSFKEKYGVSVVGTNISMPEGELRLLGLDFQIYGPLTREEFIEEFRSNYRLVFYMEKPEVSVNNIDIALFVKDRNGYSLIEPNISVAGVNDGYIKYHSMSSSGCLPFASSYRETYEEAKSIVENEMEK